MEKKKRSEAQIRAIRRSYAIRAKKKQKKSPTSDRKTRTEKQEGRGKKQGNVTKKGKAILPKSIKDNVWNVHYINSNDHSHIVIASENKEAMTLGTTTEKKDKHPKIAIQDGLVPDQKEKTFVKTTAKVVATNQIQRRKPNSRITKRDKEKIYEAIKDNQSNVEKYEKLGSLIPEEKKNKKKN